MPPESKLVKSMPPPTPESGVVQEQSIKELIPNNFSVFPDIVKALRSHNFRRYFLGQCVSLTGFWVQQIAMSWLVLSLAPNGDLKTFSMVIFLANIPSLFLTPFTGVVCDIFDRRKILICTQLCAMILSFVLAALTLTGNVRVFEIMCISFLFGVIVSFDAPARQSFYSKLVPPSDLSNAIALNSMTINGARLIGPALGGFLIGIVGEGWCFMINALSFCAVLYSLFTMKLKPSPKVHIKMQPIKRIGEGFAYMWASIPLRSILLMLTAFSVFGAPFMMLLSPFVKDILHLQSRELGFVMSSVGLGALTAAVYLAARKSVLGLGKVIMLSCFIFGVMLISLSFVRSLWLALIFAAPLGFCMIALAASSNTLLQTIVDDSKRGRVMSIFTMSFFGITPMGSLIFGYLSDFWGLTNMMLSGGGICIITAFVFMRFRGIIRKHTRKIYVEKGIVSEIAVGLRSSGNL